MVKAAISGAAIAELTLLLHYGIGYLIGVYGSTIFMANSFWFIAALVLCAPLGVCGWIAALPKKVIPYILVHPADRGNSRAFCDSKTNTILDSSAMA